MRRVAVSLIIAFLATGCGGRTGEKQNGGEGPPAQAGKAGEKGQSADPRGEGAGPADAAAADLNPGEVARRFLDAAKKRDFETVKSLVTKKARPEIEKNMGKGGPIGEHKLGRAVVKGEKAHVPFTETEDGMEMEMALLLRREGGVWRVYGAVLGGSPEEGLTMNFEEPQKLQKEFEKKIEEAFESGDVGISIGPGAAPEPPRPLQSVSIEEFNRAWKTDLDATDRPAGELLAELAGKVGLKLDERSRRLTELEKPVSVHLQGVSYAEAIEEVCRNVGVHPVYKTEFDVGRTLGFQRGRREHPAVFAGPFLVAVESFEVKPQYATGELELTVIAFGLPDAVEYLIEAQNEAPLALKELAASSGRDVRGQGVSWSTRSGSQRIPLNNLLRDVSTLSVRGTIQVPVPTDVQQLRFTELEPGTSQRTGEVEVTLRKSEPQSVTHLQFQYRKPASSEIDWTAYDGQGQPLRIAGRGSFSFGERVSRELMVSGRAAAVEVEIPGSGRSVRFEKLQAGAKQNLAGSEVTLKKVRFEQKTQMEFEFTGVEPDRIQIVALNEEGEPLADEGRFSVGGGRPGSMGGSIDTTVLGTPAEVVAAIVAEVETAQYEVELEEVPVPEDSARPVRLEPVEFAGPQPVAIEYVGIFGEGNFRKVRLRVTNKSNKDIDRLDMRLNYLDGSGRKLKDWPAHHSGPFNASFDAPPGQWQRVLQKDATAAIEVTAFFMPEETKSVAVDLEEVHFADASRWESPKKK